MVASFFVFAMGRGGRGGLDADSGAAASYENA